MFKCKGKKPSAAAAAALRDDPSLPAGDPCMDQSKSKCRASSECAWCKGVQSWTQSACYKASAALHLPKEVFMCEHDERGGAVAAS